MTAETSTPAVEQITTVTRAITIRQPYAQCIAEAATLTAAGVTPKLVENRSRPVAEKHIGQQVAIHAGLTWSKEGAEDVRVREAWRAFRVAIERRSLPGFLTRALASGDDRTGVVGGLRPGLWLEQGVVVAVATLTGCHEADQTSVATCCAPWGDRLYTTPAGVAPAWHLTLADVRRLPRPVAARGSLSVPWTLPADVAAEVQRQLDALAVTP